MDSTKPTEHVAWLDRGLSVSAQRLLIFLLFLILIVALHQEGFKSPMIYDSEGWINGKAHVYARQSLLDVLGIVPVRPLFMGSLYLNYMLTGLDPWWFRLTNAAILAGSGLVLVILCTLIFETPAVSGIGTPSEKRITAFFLGLVFVVHPLQTFVVLYIWQREAAMACLFYFLCMAAYIAGNLGRFSRPGTGLVLTGMLFLAGLMTKENLATIPAALILVELVLFRRKARELLGRTVIIVAAALGILLLHQVITYHLHGIESIHQQGVLARLYDYYQKSGLTVGQVVLTETRVVFSYLTMIVAPFVHSMQLVAAQTISTSLWSPIATLPAAVGVATMIAAGVGLLRKAALVSFGILFFFVTLAPECLLIPQYLYFGYRPILPMAGILLALTVPLPAVIHVARARLSPRLFSLGTAAALLVPVVVLSSIAVSQAKKWNPLAFWSDAYAHLTPFSKNVERLPYQTILVNLGAVLIDSGQYAEAIPVLRKALELDPLAPMAMLNLGLALSKEGEGDKSREVLKAAVQAHPQMPAAWVTLGQTLVETGDTAEGIKALRRAVALSPGDGALRVKLAEALIEAAQVQEAVAILQRTLKTDPTNPAAHFQMGLAMRKIGNLAEAVRQFRMVLSLNPSSAAAYQALMVAERELKDARAKPANQRQREQRP